MPKFIQTILLLACFTFAIKTHAQIINIPDANFKAKLLAATTTIDIAKDSIGNNIKIDINNNNEIEQSEALRVYKLYVGQSSLSDLTGINFFTNVMDLHCYANQLSTLDVSGLKNLQILYCAYNQLLTLNVSGLTNLQQLICQETQLSSLNVNDLTSLRWLICDNNKLSSLNLGSLVNLERLQCKSNQLSGLNLSGQIKLQWLECNNNQIPFLNVNHLTNLQRLYCNQNQLSSLNIVGLKNLEWLECNNNQLFTLNVSGLKELEWLDCSHNKLPTLNVSGCTNLSVLYCNNNNLIDIYMKENKYLFNHNNHVFHSNPNLRYICAEDSNIFGLKQRLYLDTLPNVTVNSFCSSTLNGGFYNLSSTVKLDLDNNGCTSQDANYPNLKFKLKSAADSGYIIADVQGSFAIDLDSGTYILTPQLLNSYFNITPSSTTITLPEDTIPQQFCVTSNGIKHDVSVTIIPIRPARPGFSDAKYKVVLRNIGNQIEEGNILFTYDEDKQDYISATATPNNTANGELTFNFSNLQLFETREIIVTMRTNAPTDNPAVNVGDVLVLSVNATLTNGVRDEYFKNNISTITQTTVGAIDPNDKTCLEGNVITPTLVGDFVNYLIRFENTGTANAENVEVTDFIDLAKFDISTLEITSTSHSCKTIISNGNKVQFVFDNIQLPFTEPLKHGYVAFKIKTKNDLVIGDSLKNSADIYFDYNLPLKTNTATTKITNLTVIKNISAKEGSISVFPNPSNGNFTLNFESKGSYPISIKIIDIKGSIVYENIIQHSERSSILINKQNLSSGLYQINITSDKDNWIQKLMIAK